MHGLVENPERVRRTIDFENVAKRSKLIAQAVNAVMSENLKILDLNSTEVLPEHGPLSPARTAPRAAHQLHSTGHGAQWMPVRAGDSLQGLGRPDRSSMHLATQCGRSHAVQRIATAPGAGEGCALRQEDAKVHALADAATHTRGGPPLQRGRAVSHAESPGAAVPAPLLVPMISNALTKLSCPIASHMLYACLLKLFYRVFLLFVKSFILL